MILITTSYDCDIQRTQELAYCRKQNHKEFWRIFLLYEQIAGTTRVWRRQTIADAFDAKFDARIPDGEVVVIANADCWFDHTIQLANQIKQDEFWCLAKRPHSLMTGFRSNQLSIDANHSQDAWAFKAPVKQYLRDVCWHEKLEFGKMGVDNRLAYLAANAGYVVRNPSKSVMVWHCHDNYVPKPLTTKVPGNYLLVEPEFL